MDTKDLLILGGVGYLAYLWMNKQPPGGVVTTQPGSNGIAQTGFTPVKLPGPNDFLNTAGNAIDTVIKKASTTQGGITQAAPTTLALTSLKYGKRGLYDAAGNLVVRMIITGVPSSAYGGDKGQGRIEIKNGTDLVVPPMNITINIEPGYGFKYGVQQGGIRLYTMQSDPVGPNSSRWWTFPYVVTGTVIHSYYSLTMGIDGIRVYGDATFEIAR